MDVLTYQVIFLFTLFLLPLFSFLFPFLFLSRRQKYYCLDTCIIFVHCLSTGSFVGACFLGLIPFSNIKLNLAVKELGYDYNHSYAEIVVVVGFFIMLFFDELVRLLQRRNSHSSYQDANCNDADLENLLDDESEEKNIPSNSNGTIAAFNFDLSSYKSARSWPYALIGVFYMSIQSFFEGIVVGLQTEANFAFIIFISIIIYRTVMSFSIGVHCFHTIKSKCGFKKFMISFFFGTPSGQILGMIISQFSSYRFVLVNGILQSFAAGTFIHVIFMCLMPSIFMDKRYNLLKILFISIGFVMVTTLRFAFP